MPDWNRISSFTILPISYYS